MCILCDYCVDLFKYYFNFVMKSCRFHSKFFIDGMCVVALAHAVIKIRGSTFHPLAVILSISGLYLLFFASSNIHDECWRATLLNLVEGT